jgi:hypothetical protein
MATSSALKMGFEKEIGAQPPLGFWVWLTSIII